MNLFEIAARKKFRFPSVKGELTAEQLWDLPLRGSVSLNAIAISLDAELKKGSISFVDDVSTADNYNSQRLEIVKHVIQCHKAAEAAREKAEADRALLSKLLDEKARRAAEAFENLSDEELEAKLKEVSA